MSALLFHILRSKFAHTSLKSLSIFALMVVSTIFAEPTASVCPFHIRDREKQFARGSGTFPPDIWASCMNGGNCTVLDIIRG
jgi:hypothetical protein